MNGFNKIDAEVFLMQAMLPGGFPFHQFNSTVQSNAACNTCNTVKFIIILIKFVALFITKERVSM